MRITNSMIANNFLSDLQNNLSNLSTIDQQLTSGKNFRKPSDDPFNVARSMQMHSAINANKQYNTNIVNTINWMDTTDTALGQLGNVFQTIREKLISAGNAAYGKDERQKIKDEINERIGQISQILNTSFDGEYIFSGTKGASKPVDTTKLPTDIAKSNAVSGDMTIMGNYTGDTTVQTDYTIQVSNATEGKETIKVSTDGGKTFSKDISAVGGIFDIGNGLKVRLASSDTNKKDDIYTFSLDNNAKIVYSQKDGQDMQVKDVQSDAVADISKWSNGTISFCCNGKITEIKLGALDAKATMDDLVSSINSAISSSPDLKGNLIAEKTSNGLVAFKVASNDVINISKTSIKDLESIKGQNLQSTQFDMLKNKRNTEISQGVLVDYNISAVDVMKYGDGNKDDIRSLLQKIVNHLDGKDDNGNPSDSSIKDLTNQDLKDIDNAMKQILKVRSEVGAKQNRMDSAKEQNEQGNFNMTEILSKTEDVDYAKKTMEFATLQTAYLASLQASAKVLQPTLMDYLR